MRDKLFGEGRGEYGINVQVAQAAQSYVRELPVPICLPTHCNENIEGPDHTSHTKPENRSQERRVYS
jgi:hypothetical protein